MRAHVGQSDRLLDRRFNESDDGLGHIRRTEEPHPGVDLIAFEPSLIDRRQIRIRF
jgi:hypothetical protein